MFSPEGEQGQQTESQPKEAYQKPQLEDYGTVSTRTQFGYGYGADGGALGYNFGYSYSYN
jgi:hypothetical protein